MRCEGGGNPPLRSSRARLTAFIAFSVPLVCRVAGTRPSRSLARTLLWSESGDTAVRWCCTLGPTVPRVRFAGAGPLRWAPSGRCFWGWGGGGAPPGRGAHTETPNNPSPDSCPSSDMSGARDDGSLMARVPALRRDPQATHTKAPPPPLVQDKPRPPPKGTQCVRPGPGSRTGRVRCGGLGQRPNHVSGGPPEVGCEPAATLQPRPPHRLLSATRVSCRWDTPVPVSRRDTALVCVRGHGSALVLHVGAHRPEGTLCWCWALAVGSFWALFLGLGGGGHLPDGGRTLKPPTTPALTPAPHRTSGHCFWFRGGGGGRVPKKIASAIVRANTKEQDHQHTTIAALEGGGGLLRTGWSLTEKKKLFQNIVFSKTTACSSSVQSWLVAIGGWRLVEIAGWQLAVGGWRLVEIGGWQLAVGGWRRLAAVGSW